jgi:hypothetical protein
VKELDEIAPLRKPQNEPLLITLEEISIWVTEGIGHIQ